MSRTFPATTFLKPLFWWSHEIFSSKPKNFYAMFGYSSYKEQVPDALFNYTPTEPAWSQSSSHRILSSF